MRYSSIRKMDISNGPDIRASIFVQGCTFNCKGCFNPDTHDFNGGKEYTEETKEAVLQLCENKMVKGLSILGGEPLHPNNIEEVTKLAKAFKERFPDKNLWVWSGFLYETYVHDKEIARYIDVLVDGQFVLELKDLRLPYCGSSNQRVIDVKKTRETGSIVLYKK